MINSFFTNYSDTTFLEKIKDNLRRCDSFAFSVSFIKKAGLSLLANDIEAALARGCKGKLITSTYQNFTDIESLKTFKKLMEKYPSFQCHLDMSCFHDSNYRAIGYHTKGYMFEFDDYCEFIIGSSNITRYALLKNIEWDLAVSDDKTSPTYIEIQEEFDDKWDNTCPLDSEVIKEYSQQLSYSIERWDMDYEMSVEDNNPNFMQRKALKELNRYRALGTTKALVVAAAGSGKTFLAAFDARNFAPKKLLYIVHEGSILEKSLETFQQVFGNSVTFGMYTGNSKDIDADFLFATNVSIASNIELFAEDEFEYIIIDECHHATASTYKKIIEYFKPEFLLGLTATPERMDNEDVFELFDQNVPYELRMRDAIINDLIVPFRYFGIRDKLIDYGLSNAQERKMISQLATEEHCEFVQSEIEKHRPQGKLKALAFCRNISHARMMCEAMGQFYNTAYLTGKNTVGERIKAYNDLQNDDADLEILFTVDILNEGVDIPGVNMVLFLRPTESSTIFIQQLGRGLRKYENKDYVTVLDFIGNSYKRSVQIAFALGSLSENFVMEKRLMKSMVKDDFKALGLDKYGVEIHIDELSKEEITEYIDQENFNSFTYIKKDYENFKQYIGSKYYPTHIDFINAEYAPDMVRFIRAKANNNVIKSYYNFLELLEEEIPIFDETQRAFIEYASDMLPLVRKHEYLILQCILNGNNDRYEIEKYVKGNVPNYDKADLDHALEYIVKSGFALEEGNAYVLNVELKGEFVEWMEDLISYGLARYSKEFTNGERLKLWYNYRKEQGQLICRKNPNDNMKGTYVYDGEVYIYAALKKDASTAEHLNYKDKFIEPDVFQWECEAGLNEERQKELIDSKQAHVFVRKVKTENGLTLPFTYVGTGKLTNPRVTENVKGTLLFDVDMDNSLPDYLQYDFGVGEQ